MENNRGNWDALGERKRERDGGGGKRVGLSENFNTKLPNQIDNS